MILKTLYFMPWLVTKLYLASRITDGSQQIEREIYSRGAHLKRRTPQEALEFLVSVSNESYGFQTLADMQLAEFTFESVVVRFPNLFAPEQVEKAQRRLDDILENRGDDLVYPEIKKNLF